MALNVSHGAFDGDDAAFLKLRQIVALAMGGSYPPHLVYDEHGRPMLQAGTDTPLVRHDLPPDEWVWGDGYTWESHPGLGVFFSSGGDEGQVHPETCSMLADELAALLPEIERVAPESRTSFPGRAGSYPEAVRRFIYGCRRAAGANEYLTFG